MKEVRMPQALIEAAFEWFCASLHQDANGWAVYWRDDRQALQAIDQDKARKEAGLFLALYQRSLPRALAHQLACRYLASP
jgi:hypothetical protein